MSLRGMVVSEAIKLPLLPLRDVVVYPHMVIPLFVGREKSIAALEVAMAHDKQILLVAQKSADINAPQKTDVYSVGTLGNILQLLKLPDGTVKVLVEGTQRVKIESLELTDKCHMGLVTPLQDEIKKQGQSSEILVKTLIDLFGQYVKLNRKISQEVLTSLAGVDEQSRLADTIAAHMFLKLADKQAILEILDVQSRMEHIIALIDTELDFLHVEKSIRGRVRQQMEKSQREYYLNEQMKAIQKELGDINEEGTELDELAKKVESSGLSKEARKKTESELKKLKMMPPMSAEATVVRNYIDTVLELPWKRRSRTKKSLTAAEKILDEDHYGLEKVKERILEYLAVQQRVNKLQGPILCLVGPPGVGKTSLGRSIARATGRKFARMALGGVRDEAEIRGHRRTYIGAMPGKIIQNISKVGTHNPLFLLDEIDKMSVDFRGDPASALLEVLDPEQNRSFNDHYLEVDYDLSDVMFIATSNSMNIPAALLDRMEVIRIPGYTEKEKINIAYNYLLPKQMKQNGIKPDELLIESEALRYIVRLYTREAGVRGLERELSKICRKVVKAVLLKQKSGQIVINPDDLEEYLGVQRFRYGQAEADSQVGLVTGLAWTEVGGELLSIEAAAVMGKGKLNYTGQLGDIMQESIQAAMTVVRSRSDVLDIAQDFYEKKDIHIHVPEGATPKDGPSAGIAMCTALVSVLTHIPVRHDVAMTGEITLRGEVLPIGGLKEKLLAAHRGGIKTVLIPDENRKDLADIPKEVIEKMEIKPVRWVDEVLDIALAGNPYKCAEIDISKEKTGEIGNKNKAERLRHH